MLVDVSSRSVKPKSVNPVYHLHDLLEEARFLDLAIYCAMLLLKKKKKNIFLRDNKICGSLIGTEGVTDMWLVYLTPCLKSE